MSIFSSLIDVEFDTQGLLIDVAQWLQKYALDKEAIADLSKIVDKNMKFKKALAPLEAVDDKIIEGILKGIIKPEEGDQ